MQLKKKNLFHTTMTFVLNSSVWLKGQPLIFWKLIKHPRTFSTKSLPSCHQLITVQESRNLQIFSPCLSFFSPTTDSPKQRCTPQLWQWNNWETNIQTDPFIMGKEIQIFWRQKNGGGNVYKNYALFKPTIQCRFHCNSESTHCSSPSGSFWNCGQGRGSEK